MGRLRGAILVSHLLSVSLACLWVPWKAKLPNGKTEIALPYSFLWSPPKPSLDLLSEARIRFGKNPNIRPIIDPLSVPSRTKANAWRVFYESTTPDAFNTRLESVELAKEVKAVLWETKFANYSDMPFDSIVTFVPGVGRNPFVETAPQAKGKTLIIEPPQTATPKQSSRTQPKSQNKEIDLSAGFQLYLESMPKGSTEYPDETGRAWTDADILDTLKDPTYFRATFPDYANLSDSSVRRKVEQYEQRLHNQFDAAGERMYAYAAVDIKRLLLELVALTALFGSAFMLNLLRPPRHRSLPRQE